MCEKCHGIIGVDQPVCHLCGFQQVCVLFEPEQPAGDVEHSYEVREVDAVRFFMPHESGSLENYNKLTQLVADTGALKISEEELTRYFEAKASALPVPAEERLREILPDYLCQLNSDGAVVPANLEALVQHLMAWGEECQCNTRR